MSVLHTHTRRALLTAAAAILLISSCGKKEETVGVSSVTVTPSRIEIIEGGSAALSASVSPEAASDRAVAWSSSDRSVVTVDKTGTVQGLKPGTATVTATAEGKSGTCAVTVKAKAVGVTDVTLDRAELTLTEGETETLTATVRPDNADNRKVTWSSDKTEVATVDGAGRVTAVKPGEAVVTVTTEDGGFRSGCTVTVKEFSSGFEVGGLFYKTAEGYSMDFVEVTGNQGGGKYSGDVVVPGTVEYDGITYTVKGVVNRAFEGCGDLRKVTISEGIYKIGAYAFCYCGNLERVILPSTLEYIDNLNRVFTGCSKLEIITTAPREGQEDYYYLYDEALYMHINREKREILSWIPEKKTGTVVIKEGTTKIADYSIYLTNVDKIVIPESVKSIDINTFVSCKTPLVLELNWKTKEDVDEITTSAPSSFFFNGTNRSAVKVTVPKGTKSYYESHWLWSNLGGIEERP